ncbi:MAG: hypothetical protein V7459_03485 [Oceanicoccus sp.]
MVAVAALEMAALMSDSLFSQSWYRVSELKPRLRSHAERVRHQYRGETWYLLRDKSTGKLHRFSESANLLIAKMDGTLSMDEIWVGACAELGDDMPGQDETIQLLSHLYRSNALQTDVIPDLEEMYQRQQSERRAKLLQMFKSPLAVRIPLWNPTSFLRKTKKLSPLIFNYWSGILWLLVVSAALLQVAMNWQALTDNFSDQAFSIGNWLAIACVYPLVKLFHELSHAYAVKRWGGDVHEMGLMFLVLIPVPYVDASSSALFRNKYQRIMVSLAGIAAELFLAAVAMLLWVEVEQGIFRALLFNVMLIGGVSTVLFNGNPLLRFDAYYALADWLELPNLGQRANAYVGYITKKYLLRQREVSPSASKSESAWLFTYSISAFCYRIFLMLTIALYVASQFFFIGVMLAFWSIYQSLVAPLIKIVKSIWPESLMRNYRTRLVLTSGACIGGLYALLFIIPLPSFTVVQGVYWPENESQLHAGADCFVRKVLVKQSQRVTTGEHILQCESIDLDTQARVVKLRLHELKMQRRAALRKDVVEASVLRDEISRLRSEQALLEQRRSALIVQSPIDGFVQLDNIADLENRFIQRGSYLGHIGAGVITQAGDSVMSTVKAVRVVIPQDSISLVRSDTHEVFIRSGSHFADTFVSKILREVPAANKEILSSALTLNGGGTIAVDPSSNKEATALENWFQFELVVPENASGRVGERVYARFTHSPEPLGQRLLRAVRLLFLEKLAV